MSYQNLKKPQIRSSQVWLSVVCCFLSFIVLSLGAYTRLKEAGLGCPDWPGCYGHWSVPSGIQAISLHQDFPGWVFEADKAWTEMIHRYAAGCLLILTLFASIVRRSGSIALIFVLMIGQATLGMWTVTYRLWPMVVLAHLMGGMLIFSLWFAQMMRDRSDQKSPQVSRSLLSKTLTAGLYIGLCLIWVQIALGGWMSANQASLACLDFPYCEEPCLYNGSLMFHSTGQFPSDAVKRAIHMLHRIGACIVSFYIIMLSMRLMSLPSLDWVKRGCFLCALILLQVVFGILNVLWQLPVFVALLHHGIAMMMAAFMMYLIICTKSK